MRGASPLSRWAVLATLPSLALAVAACSGSTTPASAPTSTTRATTASTTSTTRASGAQLPDTGLAAFSACESDFRIVEIAVDAYQAQTGAYPAPPAPWSAATYLQNYTPLTGPAKGGSFMKAPPSTSRYVIEYDASGNVWIEPPGQYDTAYNPARAASDDACVVAVETG